MKSIQRKYLIIGGIIVLLIVIGWFIYARNKNKNTESKEPLPTEQVIPTLDSSVKIDLKNAGNGKEVILQADDLPSGTQTVDYELSYNTAAQGLQGVIGAVTLEDGDSTFQKKITLGTCSSGSCVYHQVVGKIRLNLKFTGDYGEKVFNKDYTL